jgi:RNA-binding protein
MIDKKTKRDLKARSHHIKPVVMVGSKQLTENVLNEIDIALNAHELIKIRVSADNKDERNEITQAICEKSGAELINSIGYVITIYRKRPAN